MMKYDQQAGLIEAGHEIGIDPNHEYAYLSETAHNEVTEPNTTWWVYDVRHWESEGIVKVLVTDNYHDLTTKYPGSLYEHEEKGNHTALLLGFEEQIWYA